MYWMKANKQTRSRRNDVEIEFDQLMLHPASRHMRRPMSSACADHILGDARKDSSECPQRLWNVIQQLKQREAVRESEIG